LHLKVGDRWTFSAFVRDLTESKRIAEALRETREELAWMSRLTAMGELSASIAHEIKQPLSAIISNTETSLYWLARSSPDIEKVRAIANELDTMRIAQSASSDAFGPDKQNRLRAGTSRHERSNQRCAGPYGMGVAETSSIGENRTGFIVPMILAIESSCNRSSSILSLTASRQWRRGGSARVLSVKSDYFKEGEIQVSFHDTAQASIRRQLTTFLKPSSLPNQMERIGTVYLPVDCRSS